MQNSAVQLLIHALTSTWFSYHSIEVRTWMSNNIPCKTMVVVNLNGSRSMLLEDKIKHSPVTKMFLTIIIFRNKLPAILFSKECFYEQSKQHGMHK